MLVSKIKESIHNNSILIKISVSSNHKNSFALLLLFFLTFSYLESFAQSQITLDTGKSQFSPGDSVELKGKVEGAPNQLVAIEVKDPDGNIILIRTVMTDSDGSYVLKFKIPPTAKSGSYVIVTNAEVNGTTVTETKEIYQTAEESTTKQTSSDNKGCLIATAAFGSELSPQVQMLRETRDNMVMQTQSGAAFMTAFNSVYYTFAPTVADWERENSVFKEIVKATITPLITTLSILNYVNIDSEAEMLGYGIGVILLNIGMYFVAPAFVTIKLIQRWYQREYKHHE